MSRLESEMKIIAFFLAILVYGCSNDNAQNKVNFEACIERAEQKYRLAFSDICIKQRYDKSGECSYNIESNKALVRSKDNEITACATMYAPKR